MTIGTETDYYVMQANGTITIPSAGNWTFGANTDDGFSATINGTTFSADGIRSGDAYDTINFASAGTYPVTFLQYQNNGSSYAEFYAAQGAYAGFNSSFRLVGDTADGGLNVTSTPFNGTSGSGGPLAAAVATNVKPAVQAAIATAGRTSLYVRIKFDAPSYAALSTLTLKMQYDDGYVAYLNGVQIASANAPSSPTWNSLANEEQSSDVQATTYENVDVSSFLNSATTGHLAATGNVLAIQVLMSSSVDGDLLVVPELAQMTSVVGGDHVFDTPTPGAANALGDAAAGPRLQHETRLLLRPLPVDAHLHHPGRVDLLHDRQLGAQPEQRHAVHRAAHPQHHDGRAGGDGRCQRQRGGPTRPRPTSSPSPWPPSRPPRPASPRPGTAPSTARMWRPITRMTLGLRLHDAADHHRPVVAAHDVDRHHATPICSAPTASTPIPTTGIWRSRGRWSTSIPTTPARITAPWWACRCTAASAATPRYMKHSIAVCFDQSDGPSSMSYDIFGDGYKPDRLILRHGFNDGWSWGGATPQFIIDQWTRDALTALGTQNTPGVWVQLFVNGLYWGLYNAVRAHRQQLRRALLRRQAVGLRRHPRRLRFQRRFREYRRPGTRCSTWPVRTRGTGTASPRPGLPTAYALMAQYLNLPSFCDYIITNYYGGNWDWDGHNYSAIYSTTAGTGFVFQDWDGEGMLQDPNANITSRDTSGGPTELLRGPDGQLRLPHDVRRPRLPGPEHRPLADQRGRHVPELGQYHQHGRHRRVGPLGQHWRAARAHARELERPASTGNSARYFPGRTATMFSQFGRRDVHPRGGSVTYTMYPSFSPPTL